MKRFLSALVLLVVVVMWKYSVADTTSSIAEIRVPAGTTRELPQGSTLLIVDSLVLEKNAVLKVHPDTRIFTIKAKKSEFGAGSHILAKGLNADQGKNGRDGTTLYMYLGEAKFLGATIDTSGGSGGSGISGHQGATGLSAGCPDSHCKNGHTGGIGGNGGNGGNGGDIYIFTSNNEKQPTNLLLRPAGGKGGPKGSGGPGGAGGNGVTCGAIITWNLGSCYNGHKGQDGKDGLDGSVGKAEYKQLSEEQTLASIREGVKVHFPAEVQNAILKQIQ